MGSLVTALTFDTRVLQKLSERLHEELKARNESVLSSALETHAEYMRKVGEYYGVMKALELMQDVEKEMNR
jgi:hypothetical protein